VDLERGPLSGRQFLKVFAPMELAMRAVSKLFTRIRNSKGETDLNIWRVIRNVIIFDGQGRYFEGVCCKVFRAAMKRESLAIALVRSYSERASHGTIEYNITLPPSLCGLYTHSLPLYVIFSSSRSSHNLPRASQTSPLLLLQFQPLQPPQRSTHNFMEILPRRVLS
jgi:hypothetical protein